jgi:hypothetical protein
MRCRRLPHAPDAADVLLAVAAHVVVVLKLVGRKST